jgi:hypothetical protein
MTKKQAPRQKNTPRPSKQMQTTAMYIASVVRNAMEDFHCRHLSDEQMKELNPIIRDAICTALFAQENYHRSIAAQNFVDFNIRLIPGYWEKPKLTANFLEGVKYFEEKEKDRLK